MKFCVPDALTLLKLYDPFRSQITCEIRASSDVRVEECLQRLRLALQTYESDVFTMRLTIHCDCRTAIRLPS